MQREKKKKIPIKRLLSNIWYILRLAFEEDTKLVLTVFVVFTIGGVGYAVMDTLFLRAFINYLSDPSYSLKQTIVLVSVATISVALIMALERCVESLSEPGIVRLTGRLQDRMIRKAVTMDMVCYDHDSYYDDFVVAASQLEDMVMNAVLDLGRVGRNMATILIMSGLVTVIDPVIAIFPVTGFLVNMWSRFRIMRLEYEYDVESKKILRRADYSKRVFYQPEYAKEIKLTHIENPLKRQFDEALDQTALIAGSYGWRIAIWSLVNWITVFTFLSFFCVPLYLGYLALVVRKIRLGDVAALNNAQGEMRNRFDGMNYCLERMQNVGQYAERFRRFMEYESRIEGADGKERMPSRTGELCLEHVSFRYEGAKKDTLQDIQMKIRPGEKIAIVGENGAGKSTFVKLLMRLYDVTEGKITYGGEDIRNFGTEEYRAVFGTVFQDFQIYAATLADNVEMGRVEGRSGKQWETTIRQDRGQAEEKIKKGRKQPGGTIRQSREQLKETIGQDREQPEIAIRQDKEMEAALRQADFLERLERMPDGLDTMLTYEFAENGVALSGGESQKVAIARLFFKKENLQIAILDEPSSALDPKAEYELNKNILNRTGDATVIFISHRLSTTKDADRIYLFENGTILEEGSHEELMRVDGQYAKMFRLQAKKYRE